MLKKTISVLFIFSICAASVLWLPNAVFAIHKGAGGLVCGNCHTMHNSQGSTSTGDGNGGLGGNAGGSLVLLRGAVTTRADVHKLCLQCHATNGAQATTSHTPQMVQAPKVWSSATWDDTTKTFGQIGAGGNFSTELSAAWTVTTTPALGYGHSLGETNVVPPGGDLAITTFSCTNCHDPHGTTATTANINLFRNLRVSATGASANSGVQFITDPANPQREHKSYVGGVNPSGTSGYFGGSETDGVGIIWPVYKGALIGTPATDNGNTNSYGTGYDANYPIRATMSRWCAQCHDRWHEAIVPANYAGTIPGNDVVDWNRHPVNGMMPRKATAGCAAACHISLLDRTNYDSTLITAGKGLPVTASDYYTGNLVYYLPYEAPCSGAVGCMDATGGGSARDNHKVFCLSCHFAHAGPYRDSLRWDYLVSASQGSQNGNSIASTKGCQLCHNR